MNTAQEKRKRKWQTPPHTHTVWGAKTHADSALTPQEKASKEESSRPKIQGRIHLNLLQRAASSCTLDPRKIQWPEK